MFRERESSVRWVLPEGQYNPVVGEGVRWLDYERAAEDAPGDVPATTEAPSSREGSAPLTPCAAPSGHGPPEAPTSRPPAQGPPASHGDTPNALAAALDVLTGLATSSGTALTGPHAGDRETGGSATPGGARSTSAPAEEDGPDGATASDTMSAAEPSTPPAPAANPESWIWHSGGPNGHDTATSTPPEPGTTPVRTSPTQGFGAAVRGMRRLELGEVRGSGPVPGNGRHPLDVRVDRGRNNSDGDWFERERRPPRLTECRPYGLPGGLAQPDPQVEQDLAQALEPGTRFPDPRGTWVRLINGGGPADDPFRASNAADCALAVLSTWHGEPATAAPRLPEYDRIGRPLLTGEQGGAARIERWTGQRFQYAGQGRHAYPMVARRLLEAGHGASAVIVVRWPGGGSHVWNAVNSGSEVIWIDAQRGHMSVEPPYATVTGVFCMILDRQGRPR
ncbi:toxin glutamine deamidase domain-containing protein [Nonomuraea sp. WAC 01424]|uniref:toxin glutamine deamidase domain-containing protein n=1 Tax=Nonomuraea sp. WAC 01424 TaxID=2203200 RepID=UPI0021AD6EED|nr:toxin glutamine deamidase domain-containing protein [Nonomuraea sp. WAC 01424]